MLSSYKERDPTLKTLRSPSSAICEPAIYSNVECHAVFTLSIVLVLTDRKKQVLQCFEISSAGFSTALLCSSVQLLALYF